MNNLCANVIFPVTCLFEAQIYIYLLSMEIDQCGSNRFEVSQGDFISKSVNKFFILKIQN